MGLAAVFYVAWPGLRALPVTHSPDVLEKLVNLIDKLYQESADFSEQPEETQLWYNRGYANGMLKALTELGHQAQLPSSLKNDSPTILSSVRWTPWGKAYQHGLEQGCQETLDLRDSI